MNSNIFIFYSQQPIWRTLILCFGELKVRIAWFWCSTRLINVSTYFCKQLFLLAMYIMFTVFCMKFCVFMSYGPSVINLDGGSMCYLVKSGNLVAFPLPLTSSESLHHLDLSEKMRLCFFPEIERQLIFG